MNYLKNPSFKDNIFSAPPQGISGLLPVPWKIRFFADKNTPFLVESKGFGEQGQPFLPPEIIPITYPNQFPEKSLVYDQGDNTIFKVFRGGSPMWAEISQTVDLPPGQYVLTVPIFPDQKHAVGDRLIRPSAETSNDWYFSSEVKLEVDYADGRTSHTTNWLDARGVPIGQYTSLQLLLEGGQVEIVIGMRGRWGFHQNGWFLDGLDLRPTSDIPVVETIPYKSQVWVDMSLFGLIKAATTEGVTDKQKQEMAGAEAILQRLLGLPNG